MISCPNQLVSEFSHRYLKKQSQPIIYVNMRSKTKNKTSV